MITRINYNRGRRFLNPLEIEAQYHTEDRATNPDLLLWIDFTDPTALRSFASGGMSSPNSGQEIMIAENKSYFATGANAGMVSAGDKALGTAVYQTDVSKCPVYTDPGNGTPPYADFSNGDFMEAVNTLGRVSSSNFSTSEIETNKFCAYFVCGRSDTVPSQTQDVMFITTNDSTGTNNAATNQILRFSFDANQKGNFEMYDGNLSPPNHYGYTVYDTADDGNPHYHMFNAYEVYNTNSNYTSLQADGLFHQFTESYDYNKLSSPGFSISPGVSGSLTRTFQFTGTPGTYHPSITIGGQSSLGVATPAKGSFVGRIYEVLLFKSEHAGPSPLDVLFYNKNFKRRWSNMLYYFQRKYQRITPKI